MGESSRLWTYLHGGLTTVGQQGLMMAAIIRERLYKREQMGESSRLWRETRRGLSRGSEAGRSRLLVTIFNTCPRQTRRRTRGSLTSPSSSADTREQQWTRLLVT